MKQLYSLRSVAANRLLLLLAMLLPPLAMMADEALKSRLASLPQVADVVEVDIKKFEQDTLLHTEVLSPRESAL